MSVNIYDLANSLERGIRDLDEYKAVVAAKKEVDANADAKVLWEEFLEAQQKIQALMTTGQMPGEEEQKAMQELGERIEKNELLKHFFDNQQRLSVYIQDIEKIVFKPLQELAE